jgi:fatty-acyl-CoA synthase
VTDEVLHDREAGLTFDDAINIQYTSGTTGFPKGATLTHHNILNNGYFVGVGCAYTAEDRVCIPVPFYHCFGMVLGNLACTSLGAAMVGAAPRRSTRWPRSRRSRPSAATSLLRRPHDVHRRGSAWPDFERYDLTSLRTGIMAGSPVPGRDHEAVHRAHAHGPGDHLLRHDRDRRRCSTQTAVDDPIDKRGRAPSGGSHPHVEVKIVDPATGRPVRRGESGELCTGATR